jgi:hypothetical protein
MKKWSDLMIDLETLGTGTDAVVLSIGAVFFDIERNELGPTFIVQPEVESQIKKGRVMDPDTIKWWMSQGEAAKQVFKDQTLPTQHTLNLLSQFCRLNTESLKELKVWGNGSSFDISILESMYKNFDLKQPWGYNGVMDLRTFRRFVGNMDRVVKLGTDHNALDDAKSQALYVLKHANKKARDDKAQ